MKRYEIIIFIIVLIVLLIFTSIIIVCIADIQGWINSWSRVLLAITIPYLIEVIILGCCYGSSGDEEDHIGKKWVWDHFDVCDPDLSHGHYE